MYEEDFHYFHNLSNFLVFYYFESLKDYSTIRLLLLHYLEKGKPFERLGRKATGLRFKPMTAELPKIVHILGGNIVIATASDKELDKEWLDLILEARNLGISVDEIKEFLKKSS
jgi:hypothetical protein